MNETTERSNQSSSFTRGWRRLFSWRAARWAIIGAAALITLGAVLWTEENWRGKRDWERYKHELEAQGEKLDWRSFIPPPVPDDQNFFKAPIFDGIWKSKSVLAAGQLSSRDSNAVDRLQVSIYRRGPDLPAAEMSSWREAKVTELKHWQDHYRAAARGASDTNKPARIGSADSTNEFPVAPHPQTPAADVLLALSKYKGVRDALLQASQCPYARFPIDHEDGFSRPEKMLAPIVALRQWGQFLQLHGVAELADGHSERALADVKLSLRLVESLRDEGLLISHMVRVALLDIALQPIWEGLAKHSWSDPQLQELQKSLFSIDLLADYHRTMQGERAFSNEVMAQYIAGHVPGTGEGIAKLRSLMPRGMLYQNQLAINRGHQQISLPAVDAAAHRVYPDKCQTNPITQVLGRPGLYNIFARLMFPAIQRVAERTAWAQTSIDLAGIACALERCRLAQGQFPETLDALAPSLMEKVPHDIINGQPLKYQRAADGTFLLYSVGWNGVDDGGAARMTHWGEGPAQGDWVWRYPPGEPLRKTATSPGAQ